MENSFDPTRTVIDRLLHWRDMQSGTCAISFLPKGQVNLAESLSYRELIEIVACVASGLSRRGVERGDRVLLMFKADTPFLASFLGCLWAGFVPVPVSLPSNRAADWERVDRIFNDAGCRAVLTTSDLSDKIAKQASHAPQMAAGMLCLYSEVSGCSLDDLIRFAKPAADDLAFLQYTSGSTGMPKGVQVSHRNLMHNLWMLSQATGTSNTSVFVSWLPLFHDMGLIGKALHALYVGAPLHFMAPASFVQKPMCWLQAMSDLKGTFSAAPNFAYELCAYRATNDDVARLNLSGWTCAFNAAEPVRADTLRAFSERFAACGFSEKAFYPAYGLAESTLIMTGPRFGEGAGSACFDRDMLARGQAAQVDSHGLELVSVGAPLGGQEVLIVDPDTHEVLPERRMGEVWLHGPSVAGGYWNRPDVSEKEFHATPDGRDLPCLRTGDLGFFDAGELYIAGRLKDVIILNGRNIYPQDLEEIAEVAHPALRRAGAAAVEISVPSATGTQNAGVAIIAEVERSHLRRLDGPAVADAIRARVYEETGVVVDRVVLISPATLPKTSSGKVQRRKCRQSLSENSLSTVFQDGASELPDQTASKLGADNGQTENILNAEHLKTTVFAAIRARLSPDKTYSDEALLNTPYYRMALASVDIVAIAAQISQTLGYEVSAAEFYRFPTVQTLLTHLTDTFSNALADIGATAAHPDDTSSQQVPIAIIGSAMELPGGITRLSELENFLRNGLSAVRTPSLLRQLLSPDLKPQRRAGFMRREPDRFDAAFFGISPEEATLMDPQQRLAMEVAWHALEDAALDHKALRGSRTGVYMGAATHDFATLVAPTKASADMYRVTGTSQAMLSNRLSYFLGLQGPSQTLDTACSSSLVAIASACADLRAHRADIALSGGVNIILDDDIFTVMDSGGFLSPTFRCHSFKTDADGYVRAEGCAVVVLKRLSDALADGDRIEAVIHGIAVNQDGASNGLTAPNGAAQSAVIRDALAQTSLNPAQIRLIEAHGTGTPIGDEVEIAALKQVYDLADGSGEPLYVGAVKSALGHLEAAAGVTGILKAILQLQRDRMIEDSPVGYSIAASTQENSRLRLIGPETNWNCPPETRFAGVSSFGFGGTNAHAILGGVSACQEIADPETEMRVIGLSAHDEAGLCRVAAVTETALQKGVTPADVAASFNHRPLLPERCAVIVDGQDVDQAGLRQALKALSRVEENAALVRPTGASSDDRTAFLYTGHGAFWHGMGKGLYQMSPLFRARIDQASALLHSRLGAGLPAIMWGEDFAKLSEPEAAQPVGFALSAGLHDMVTGWGLSPDAVAGHSLGQYVAAYAAGCFSFEDGIALMAARGQAMGAVRRKGRMLALACSREQAEAMLLQLGEEVQQDIALSVINSPSQHVFSGTEPAISALEELARSQNVELRQVPATRAYHSHLMTPIYGQYMKDVQKFTLQPPRLPMACNVSGDLLHPESAPAQAACVQEPSYWAEHITAPVNFHGNMTALLKQGYRHFVEIGPAAVLSAFGAEAAASSGLEEETAFYPLMRFKTAEENTVPLFAARLFANNRPEVLRGATPMRAGGVVPGYPFSATRYWPDLKPKSGHHNEASAETQKSVGPETVVWTQCWMPTEEPVQDASNPLFGLTFVPMGLDKSQAALLEAVGSVPVDAETLAEKADPLYIVALNGALNEVTGAEQLLHALQSIRAPHGQMPKILVLKTPEEGCAGFEGLLRAAICEAPEWDITLLELSSLEMLGKVQYQAAIACIAKRKEPGLHLRRLDEEGHTLTAVLRPETRLTEAGPQQALSSDAIYMISGGFGDLGRLATDLLRERGARRFVLGYLRPLDHSRQDYIRELRQSGCEIRLWNATETLEGFFEPQETLAGILHCAGSLADAPLDHVTAQHLSQTMGPKSQLLERILSTAPAEKLDFLLAFSSASGWIGAPGQAAYGAANSALDTLCRKLRTQQVPALSLAWGTWSEIGVASRIGADRSLAEFGLLPISPEQGRAYLSAALDQVANFDLPACLMIARLDVEAMGRSPIYSSLSHSVKPRDAASQDLRFDKAEIHATTAPKERFSRLKDLPAFRRKTIAEQVLCEEIGRRLHLPPDRIATSESLRALGLDSLLAMGLARQIAFELSISLKAADMLGSDRSVRSIAERIHELMEEQ